MESSEPQDGSKPIEIIEEKMDSRLFGIAIRRFLNMWRNPTLNIEVTAHTEADVIAPGIEDPNSEVISLIDSGAEPTDIQVQADEEDQPVIACKIGNKEMTIRGKAATEIMKLAGNKPVLEILRELKDHPDAQT